MSEPEVIDVEAREVPVVALARCIWRWRDER